ncbi:oxidoreductase, short chain dehydrogenase/reductase family protein [Onchocerca flexuosa]|uniref:Oxidoreductase, short chain dehydrogenase/reductase family protein n=1 Tax=Onchocerca flexuosa TaxID=387005 RepID=A0A238C0E3_9BILA|nr:oxidoreductase, short chain dehydrogenase/reductase family protein [Onchocerca flexuosa]
MATDNHRRRSVLITGANQGIGYHTALQLCAKGYRVTIACRNIEKAKNACASIVNRLGNSASIDFIIIDLSELSSVSKSVHMITAQKRCYDIIILNAGVLLPKLFKTKDGFDTTFQVNYLSQFYLLNELIGVATPKEGVKIITLTSILYKFLCPKISSKYDCMQKMFSPSSGTSGWLSYARSKLATAMLACYLDRIEGIQAVGVHPGAINTAISSNISPRMRKFLKTMQVSRFLTRVEDGARNVVECVEGSHLSNTYRNNTKYDSVPKRVSDERNEINLMILSKEMIASILPDFRVNRILYNIN